MTADTEFVVRWWFGTRLFTIQLLCDAFSIPALLWDLKFML